MSLLRRRRGSVPAAGRGEDLGERLAALERALLAGGDRLETAAAARAAQVVRRGRERSALSRPSGGGPASTVVALAGATGSGKSSLLNAFVGEDVAVAGVRRPTTSSPTAVVWGDEPSALLDWLDVRTRHRAARRPGPREAEALEGLVLLDLPDHDSTDLGNALQVDRMVELVDLMVWVVDPQKYADAALHDGYLRRLTGHQDLLLVVLNQVDTLDETSADACERDLRALLAADGLPRVDVVRTSARSGEGIDDLRRAVAEAVSTTSAATRRTEADVEAAADALAASLGNGEQDVSARGAESLVDALCVAAGVPTVLDAVMRSELRAGRRATGWPALTWAGRWRRDPLARLRVLGRVGGGGGRGRQDQEPSIEAAADASRARLVRSSLSGPTPTERARVATAARSVASGASDGLPQRWADAVRASVAPAGQDVGGGVADALDQALVGVDLQADRPWWQSAALWAQRAVAVVGLVGLVWTLGWAAALWLALPVPSPVTVGREPFDLPLPWVLLGAAIAVGVLLALLLRPLVTSRARRRTAAVREELRARVAQVAAATLLEPMVRVLDDHREARLAVEQAAGRRVAR